GGTLSTAAGVANPNTGARYNPDCDLWNSLTLQNVPPGRSLAGVVWTGDAALICAGNTIGGVDYDSNFAWVPGPAVAPVITGQPQSVSVRTGTNVMLSVTVTGGSLTYQWRFNQTNIAGATTSTLLLTNVQLRDDGLYSVIVSNSAGFAISEPAKLTVLAPPQITIQPMGDIGYW